jgi:hypothetical protein
MSPRTSTIVSESPAEVFREMVGEALTRQRVRASEPAAFYLVHLLTEFVHTRRLFPDDAPGSPTLVEFLGKALASTPATRLAAFRRMGDFALFVAGFFADSLNRKLVDVDYYAAMGGGAYANASRLSMSLDSREMFDELSRQFVRFMDVISEVGERSQIAAGGLMGNQGLLRLYEIFLRTGSERARRRLHEAGVIAVDGLDTRFRQ